MFKLKIVALVAGLAIFVPPVQVQARNNRTVALIGAALIGAAIASSGNNSRNRDNDRYYGNSGYGYRQPQYERQQPYYSGSSYYTAGFAQYPPRDLYRSHYGVGYDRFGAYRYDSCR